MRSDVDLVWGTRRMQRIAGVDDRISSPASTEAVAGASARNSNSSPASVTPPRSRCPTGWPA